MTKELFNNQVIEEIKARLIKTYDPLEIYIFGSYAWGSPDEDSDLDLAVVVDSLAQQDHYQALVKGHRALMDVKIPKDILLFTKGEFDKRSDNKTTLCYKIKRKGKRIYARS